ncbi:peptidase PmbA [Steroidobacter denitrificans]|uniref:Peptidase PmbA n=1 Tax=Steroidobacter denitrificans TaxID=465721 RepID=A0A127F895_STEDE|nr:metalloprotease PmbA [Steroidobacter denitrificans]AMN46652.1 peptidase PmbA [Steroidobacter denitrificans]
MTHSISTPVAADSSAPLARQELQDIVAMAIEEARSLGASQAEVAVSVNAGLSVTARFGAVETLEYQRDRGMSVTVYRGMRRGSASTGDLKRQAVRDAVAKAFSIAGFTAEDDCAGLPDPDSLAKDIPDLDLCHPWAISPDAAREMAVACEAAALAADQRIGNSEGATLASHQGLRVFGNSLGFIGDYASTLHSLSCMVVAQEHGEMQRDYWYSSVRDWRALEDGESIGRHAAQRALRRLGARKLATQTAPVLFVPEMARGLFGHFLGAVRGSSQYRRSSFLLDSAGQQIFPSWMHISERPHLPGALGSAPFDAEGVATRDRELIDAGVLTGYILSTYSARKLGLKTTGNAGGVHNLLVRGGQDGFEVLLRRMGRGLVVTELMGQGVNGVTGDYSRGAAGFWVENGELAYPVHEITIAGNLKEMYRGIVAVGGDVDERGGIRTGSVLLERMTIAGE